MATKRILAVVEPHGRADQPVIARAAWLAERVGAEVELYSVSYDSSVETGPVAKVWARSPGLRERILVGDRRLLEKLAEPLRARGLAVTVDVAWDGPLDDAIARKVAESGPWLVAKDVEQHNILQRTFLTNADWSLIRHCEAPLLLVKPRQIASHPTIIAAIDPMHAHDKPAQLDDAIVQFADGLAVAASGVLQVVHAFAMPMRLDLPNDVREGVEQHHRAAIADFLKRHRVPSPNVHLFEGAPHDCLRRVAEQWEADFVVMGAVARTGLKRLLIGSTADRVLDTLPCDLVLLRPARVRNAAIEPIGDDAITDELIHALLEEPHLEKCGVGRHVGPTLRAARPATLASSWIEVYVENGIITLDGNVPSRAHKNLAGEIAQHVPGAREVINAISVELT